MLRIRAPLIVALVSAALLLLAFVGTTAVSFPLWFRYRNATGLGVARTVAQVAAGLAAVGFFVTAAIVAVAAALQPAGRWRKLLYVLRPICSAFCWPACSCTCLGLGRPVSLRPPGWPWARCSAQWLWQSLTNSLPK